MELIRIVMNSVKTFFDVYSSGDVSNAKEQKQFIINFMGIISNVAVFAEGRQLLVEKREGKQLIEEILSGIPKIPDSETRLRKYEEVFSFLKFEEKLFVPKRVTLIFTEWYWSPYST